MAPTNPTSPTSVRRKIKDFGVIVLVAILFLGFLSGAVFMYTKKHLLKMQLVGRLEKSMDIELNSILLGYLMPEQKEAIALLLQQTKAQNSLSDVEVFEGAPPFAFNRCSPDPRKAVVCESADSSRTAVIKPVREGARLYGYYLKAAYNRNAYLEAFFFRAILIVTLVACLLLISVLSLLALFIQKDLSVSLETLMQRLKRALNGDYAASGGGAKFKEFIEIESALVELLREHEHSRQMAVLAEIASRVAHDIRSPVTALRLATQNLRQVDESNRTLIRQAANRISDIANDLLLKHQSRRLQANGVHPTLVSYLLENVVSEKRLENQKARQIDLHMDENAVNQFVAAPAADLGRIVSNLLNNALEAVHDEGQGRIALSLRKLGPEELCIQVDDNGCGIPEEVLSRIGEYGFSFGKNGSGIGLASARSKLVAWKGDLQVVSQWQGGTQVSLFIPVAPAPDWFLPSLRLESGMEVVALDDDPSIHLLWKRLIDQAFSHSSQNKPTLRAFTESQSFRSWLKNQAEVSTKRVYLIDYELVGEEVNGMDLIEELGLAKQSILVSSRFTEGSIIKRCMDLKLQLLPKYLIGHTPIKTHYRLPDLPNALVSRTVATESN